MSFWLDVLPVVVVAVLLWWGATGLIIFSCRRKQWRPWVFGAVTAVQPLAFWQLWNSRESTDVGGVFMAFFWAFIIWCWVETGYYAGFVVGRSVPELEPDAPTGLRFRRAIAANLYHELFILALSVAVIVAGWGGSNEIGLWTFMILHWTHQSAKINIFLGVSNLTTEYLPDNLKYMAQYFTQKSLNSFFPFSVTASIVIATLLFNSILASPTAGQQVGQAILFIVMVAAILEHWWLVIPMQGNVWEWALKSSKSKAKTLEAAQIEVQSQPSVQIICGYLGSGKTSLIRHLLPQLKDRVAVIVNDFGAVGVDAELIRAEGLAGAVIELPGGCVCCTLQRDLTGQILKLLESYQPERIIIEPSGVAGIEEIVRAIASPRLMARLGLVEVVAVVDAPRLLVPGDLKSFTLTQLRAASAVVLNKIDLISSAQVAGLLELVEAVNPLARRLTAVQGQVQAEQLLGLAEVQTAQENRPSDRHQHSSDEESGLISFGREYQGDFEVTALTEIFDRLATGYFGPVVRAKGLFITATGRQSWDLAAGRVTSRLLPPASTSEQPLTSRFMVIATDLATEELNKQFEKGIINSKVSQPNIGQELN